MFEKKTPLLYITKTHAFFYEEAGSNRVPFVATWNGTNFASLVHLIRQHTKEQTWRLLLGNDFAYVLTLTMPKEQVNDALIKQELSGRIPEEITEKNYAWTIVKETQHQSVVSVQTLVIPPGFISTVETVCQEEHLTIETITALPIVLALATRELSMVHIICWFDYEQLCLISYQGAVYYCEPITDAFDSVVQRVTQIAQKRFSITPTLLVTNREPNDPALSLLSAGHKMVNHAFQPIASILHQNDGSDDVLWLHRGDLHPLSSPPIYTPAAVSNTAMSQTVSSGSGNKSKRLFILLGILVVLLLVTIWYAYTSL